MTTFQSAAEVYATIGKFLQEIVTADDMRPKFVAANTSFRVTYTEPVAVMVVDCTVDPPQVTCGELGQDVEIDLKMSADDGHMFWMGKLNMTVALAKKKVQVAGPMSKMMKLLPAMRPAFPRYREFLETHPVPAQTAS
jgi:putative sterol carrier protein